MKALFVDRDGVINKDPGGWTEHSYVTNWKSFQFLPGAIEALKLLKEHGVKVIVISNQAGVAKGFFTEKQLNAVTRRMLQEIERSGGAIEGVLYCTHKKEDGCACRKPKTGMLDAALEKYRIDHRRTFFVGDSAMDVEAGRKAGLRTILLLCGKSTEEDAATWPITPDHVKRDLLDAVQWLVKEHML